MSRPVVLKTIAKLENLLDQEEGKPQLIGGMRRAAQPYGRGVVSQPAPFGGVSLGGVSLGGSIYGGANVGVWTNAALAPYRAQAKQAASVWKIPGDFGFQSKGAYKIALIEGSSFPADVKRILIEEIAFAQQQYAINKPKLDEYRRLSPAQKYQHRVNKAQALGKPIPVAPATLRIQQQMSIPQIAPLPQGSGRLRRR